MTSVIGPSRYLPGSILRVESLIKGHDCDECACATPPVKKPATAALIGETDSFGSEVEHYCDACIKVIEAERDNPKDPDELKYCEHCDAKAANVSPVRDPDEGSCGPVYYLCPQHRQKLLASSDDEGSDPHYYNYED